MVRSRAYAEGRAANQPAGGVIYCGPYIAAWRRRALHGERQCRWIRGSIYGEDAAPWRPSPARPIRRRAGEQVRASAEARGSGHHVEKPQAVTLQVRGQPHITRASQDLQTRLK